MRAWANAKIAPPAAFEHSTATVGTDYLQDWPTVLGESVTALWNAANPNDMALVAGKVQNLRVAAARLHGRVVSKGATFSFWRLLGKPTRRKGFVLGRELREGCMIASIGGGLCQISNALYCAALDGGLEIIERHAHSQVVPGSQAAWGRDATVYWNYVDLRFRHHQDFVVLAQLCADSLTVQIRVRAQAAGQRPTPLPRATGCSKPIAIMSTEAPSDCMTCEQTQCVEKIAPSPSALQRAFLLDEVWPEFDQWLATRARPGDGAWVPMDGARRKRANYRWKFLHAQGIASVEHRWLTLYRSLASRLLPAQGGLRQQKLLALNAQFAKAYARSMPTGVRHVVLPITLLADVWRLGLLGGRTFEVLMTRAPLQMLHDSLDQAAALHPHSPTLADFRASAELLRLENEALRSAARIVTPHRGVADFVTQRYGVAVEKLDWQYQVPVARDLHAANKLLFPASALGRKGAYEVRAACQQLGLSLKVLGHAQDDANFWQDVPVSPAAQATLFDGVACVVLPAFVEHRPRLLLKAMELGIPVVCSHACGLAPDLPRLATVQAGSVDELVAALQKLLIAPTVAHCV